MDWEGLDTIAFLESRVTLRGIPTVIVDLSNVCREGGEARYKRGQPAAEWWRFLAVVDAWHSAHGPSRLVCVADSSLLELFSDADAAEYLRARTWGELARPPAISEAEAADVPILDLAVRSGASVISNDPFGGHRRTFPMIEGWKGRFLTHSWQRRRRVSLQYRDLPPLPSWEKSVAESDDEVRALKRDLEARENYFRCITRNCELRRVSPARLWLLPRVVRTHGKLTRVCPGCGEAVVKCGRRPQSVALKIWGPGAGQVERFAVEESAQPASSFVIGRGRPVVLDWWLGGDAVHISREHAGLTVVGGVPFVRAMRAPCRIERQNGKVVELEPGDKPTGLNRDDILTLDELVRVRRSGFFVELPMPNAMARGKPDPPRDDRGTRPRSLTGAG